MKYLSSLLSSASGSVGGSTYSHNKGGSYIRRRSMPTNSRSAAQNTVRSMLGSLANLWITLTDDQRASWEAYASNVPMPDKLGQTHKISGLNMFIRSNASRAYAYGWDYIVKDAPTIFNLGATPIINSLSATFTVGGTLPLNCEVNIADAPDASEADTQIEVYVSKPSDVTNNYRKVPMALVGHVAVAVIASQPQTLTNVVELGYSHLGGQRMFVELSVTRADGRLSSRGKATCTTAPYVAP